MSPPKKMPFNLGSWLLTHILYLDQHFIVHTYPVARLFLHVIRPHAGPCSGRLAVSYVVHKVRCADRVPNSSFACM